MHVPNTLHGEPCKPQYGTNCAVRLPRLVLAIFSGNALLNFIPRAPWYGGWWKHLIGLTNLRCH